MSETSVYSLALPKLPPLTLGKFDACDFHDWMHTARRFFVQYKLWDIVTGDQAWQTELARLGITRLGPSLPQLRFSGSGPSQAGVWLGSSLAEPNELGQGSAREARLAREDVA